MEQDRSAERPEAGGGDARHAAVLARLIGELSRRDDWASHALRHDLVVLLAPRRPGHRQAPCLVLRAPRETKTQPGPQGRFALPAGGGVGHSPQ